MRVSVHGDACGYLKFFSVESGEHSDEVVGSTTGGDERMVLIDHLDEVTDDEGYSLDALELLLGPDFLSLEFLLVFLDEILLDFEELDVSFKLLELLILILVVSLCEMGQ